LLLEEAYPVLTVLSSSIKPALQFINIYVYDSPKVIVTPGDDTRPTERQSMTPPFTYSIH
ncbi:MAG: hypothetical protein QME89_11260, partial [Actinomycetota bacterium]|nr:hypothetical protein [Actinomycetota bacterium]